MTQMKKLWGFGGGSPKGEKGKKEQALLFSIGSTKEKKQWGGTTLGGNKKKGNNAGRCVSKTLLRSEGRKVIHGITQRVPS